MAKVSFFDQARKNRIKSIILFCLVVPVFILLAYVIGQIYNPELTFFFITIASLIAIIQIFVGYYYGDKVILKITNAKPATKPKYTHLINVVEGLSIAAGIPTPKVYVIENPDLNAFATGRDPKHASIAITTGLLEKLNRTELEGVIGHELSHIKNLDIRFMTLVSVIIGLVVILSNVFLRSLWFGRKRSREGGILLIIGIVLAIIAPIAVKLIQLAISRKREYLADASSAQLTRYPEGLASALEKIAKYNQGRLKVSDAVAPLFISNPKRTSKLRELFSTHPPIEKRIKILREM